MIPLTLDLAALLPPLAPPGPLFGDPPTGKSTAGCYLGATKDCEGKLSREHVISHAMLRQLAEVWVQGMRWRPGDAWTLLPAEALVANILCRRHNRLIGPLDAQAATMFAAVRGPTDSSVSGHLLERWCGKVLVGVIVGRWQGSRTAAEAVPAPWVADWLTGRAWAGDDVALHIVHERGVGERGNAMVFPRPDSATVSVGTCFGTEGHEVGAAIWFGGVPFFLSLAPEAEWRPFVPFQTTRRPSSIRLTKGETTATLSLDWSPLQPGAAVNAVAG